MTNVTEGMSSQIERDARSQHMDRGVKPSKIALGVIIGRTSEFFDFFVFGLASVLVFPRFLFPMDDALTGTLYSFAIFSLAFVARPIGSWLFMRIDRLYGRGAKLTSALFLLGFSTAAMAFLPGYDAVGFFAVWFLCVLRFLQGLALGGAWDGLASLLALNAPPNKRGWYAMMAQLGAPIGLVLACALFAYIMWALPAEDFITWGWRYPFFVAFAINVVALFARLRLVTTAEFGSLLDRDELKPSRIRDTLRSNGPTVVLGAFTPLASYALFHLVTIFPISWVVLYTNHSPVRFLLVLLLGAIISTVTILLSGVLADRIGRRPLLAVTAALIGIGSFLAPFFFKGGIVNEDGIVLAGFALLGLSFGQASGALASNFSRVHRYTGAAVTSDWAWLIGAGFAPLVALGLCARFGLIAVGAYLLSGAICTLVALYFNRQFHDD
ncbi:MFS transporter [Pararhizobium mangrovi]|uniref:MHS family MFS transporter n=1 Tax=Pararhizobium mangrovi TaxID=2590452 RepID=A0A506TZA6_9HYPH|nr:MFS transporter [Pararhizobium mangrovi]TPW26830.1 MHS family MFS transporter [Pararhizobium mangrovi]